MHAAIDVGLPGRGHVVILVHGQPGSAHNWDRVIPLLAIDHRVIAVDRPGYHGDPTEATDWVGNAVALLELMDHLAIGSAVLVGHSYGGGVALETALRAPGRVTHLVLAGSVGHRLAVRRRDRVLAWSATARIGQAIARHAGDRVVGMLVRTAGSRLDERGKELVRSGLSLADSNRAYESSHREQSFFLRDAPGLHARLGEVAVPTTVIAGYRDVLVPLAAQAALAATIPGAQLLPLKAGHLLTLEAPAALAEAIRRAASSSSR